ncbi:hypothetical protein SERVES_03214 [Serratia ficaria]|nr:lipoprotein [Serratia ficaria]VVA49458.1 hypothetical protein SERVES_03214 [Serratia ficaria]
MQMKKKLRYALLTVMLTGLAGCGLKGPLYFPPADPTDKKPAATPVQTEQVQKNQQQPSAIQQKPSMTDQ